MFARTWLQEWAECELDCRPSAISWLRSLVWTRVKSTLTTSPTRERSVGDGWQRNAGKPTRFAEITGVPLHISHKCLSNATKLMRGILGCCATAVCWFAHSITHVFPPPKMGGHLTSFLIPEKLFKVVSPFGLVLASALSSASNASLASSSSVLSSSASSSAASLSSASPF